MTKRTNQILALLTEHTKLEVSRLSAELAVSQVTIRKDLDELEQKGLVIREHGFAKLCSTDDINGRIAYHYETKKLLAQKAVELINDGDTLMIESGSCCALFAEALAASKKELTILTNSAYIADHLRKAASFQLILLGGIYQPASQVMVGPMVRQCVENFCVDLFFIGTDGYSARTGFTNRDQLRAQAVRDMAQQAEKIVILTESEKFQKHSIVPLNLKNDHQLVITDKKLTASTASELEAQGYKIMTV